MSSRRLLSLGFVLSLGLVAAGVLLVAAAGEEKVLYKKDSPYNTIVVTEDAQGLRTLYFDNMVKQSVVKVGDPDHVELGYARAMPLGLALVEKPRRVLIVGLGGGTIPGLLHKHYPRTTIDVVDIDPDVVKVARKYFGFREDATLHAHVKDGRRFIEECRDPYDIIFLDAFGADNIPYALATREFLLGVRRALAPQGVVVSNVWSRYSNPLYDSMVRTYQDVFDELYVVDVEGTGNKILMALPRKERIGRDELARRARRISKENRFRFDMAKYVKSGYSYADEKDPDAPVLHDKAKAKKAG